MSPAVLPGRRARGVPTLSALAMDGPSWNASSTIRSVNTTSKPSLRGRDERRERPGPGLRAHGDSPYMMTLWPAYRSMPSRAGYCRNGVQVVARISWPRTRRAPARKVIMSSSATGGCVSSKSLARRAPQPMAAKPSVAERACRRAIARWAHRMSSGSTAASVLLVRSAAEAAASGAPALLDGLVAAARLGQIRRRTVTRSWWQAGPAHQPALARQQRTLAQSGPRVIRPRTWRAVSDSMCSVTGTVSLPSGGRRQ